MGCASCGKNANRVQQVQMTPLQPYIFNANDIKVSDGETATKLKPEDWPDDKDKLLIFIPEVGTPVCQTELGAINKWYDEFQKLGCVLIVSHTGSAESMIHWQKDESTLNNPKYKSFASFLLPSRLGLIQNGQLKRASVFITKEGEIVKQEHFFKVGRSFEELHRQYWAYTQDSYCGEGWKSPLDNNNV